MTRPQRIRHLFPAPAAALALALLALPGFAQGAPEGGGTILLPLRSGDIVFGEVLSHDPGGLRLRRLDNGGEVPLAWDLIDPATADAMRLRLGYVEAEAEALLVDAYSLQLASGIELIGDIVDQTQDPLLVKRADGTLPIRKGLVRSITTTRAPALEVYTRDELYQIRSFELQGLLAREGRAGAQAHDTLARYAERLLDYRHALEHYTRAAELDPTLDPARLGAAIERARTRAELEEQLDFLSEIERNAARKRYAQALKDLNDFPRLHPDSALLEDWNKLKARVGKMQERDVRAEIVPRWHYWAQRLARDAARLETFEQVTGYLDEKMGQELASRVKEDLQEIVPGIDEDQVRRLWQERTTRRYKQATYGLGTWLLGDAARAELEKDDAPPAEEGSQAAERQRMAERVKRYLENQKLAQSAGRQDSPEDDPQAFWKSWSPSGKAQWILAYYAEKSGDFRDLVARFSNCRDCGGTGAREVLFTGSAIAGSRPGEVLVPCPTCHQQGIVRRIRYR